MIRMLINIQSWLGWVWKLVAFIDRFAHSCSADQSSLVFIEGFDASSTTSLRLDPPSADIFLRWRNRDIASLSRHKWRIPIKHSLKQRHAIILVEQIQLPRNASRSHEPPIEFRIKGHYQIQIAQCERLETHRRISHVIGLITAIAAAFLEPACSQSNAKVLSS